MVGTKWVLALMILGASSEAEAQDRQHTPQSVLAQTCLHEASIPVRAEDEYGYSFWARTRDHTIEWGADCWIIHEVFLLGAHQLNTERRRRGRTMFTETLEDPGFRHLYLVFALAHSEGVFNPVAVDTNRWAREVAPPFNQPSSWGRPESVCVDGVCTMVVRGAAWSRQRAGAMYAWELAGEIVQHGLATVTHWTVCREPPDTWGGTMDHEHAEASGFIPVVCDPAANEVWAYPSRVRARQRE